MAGLDLRFSDTNNPRLENAPMTWAQLLDHMDDGAFVVGAGRYEKLHGFVSVDGLAITRFQPSGVFGHAICAGDYDRASETYLHLDPLGRGNYAGDRVHISALWAFLFKTGWANADERVTVAHSFTQPRPAAPDPAADRTERRKREVWKLRKLLPESKAVWDSATGLNEDHRGKPLTQDGPMPAYLPGELLFLRRCKALGLK